ncbi:MAG: hypothetical protein J6T42_04290 [Clostridia bacterium]|nr:hypothetical protein [Clostridia bacterium]
MEKLFEKMIAEFKSKSEKRKALSLGGMISVVVALAVYLIFELAIGQKNLSFWPVWSFFIALFYSTGIYYLVFGIIKKYNAIAITGIACLIIGTFFLLISFSLAWHIVIIATAAMVFFLYGFTFMIKPAAFKKESDETDEPMEERVDDERE